MKRCYKCTQEKELEAFAKDKRRKDGRHPECKECQKPRWKKYYHEDGKNNPAMVRDRYKSNATRYRLNNTLRKFKITKVQYEQLLKDADYKCTICKQPETVTRSGRIRQLSLDHDHETGVLRGVLCGNCNAGLGQFKDDPVRVEAAAAYLRKHSHGT